MSPASTISEQVGLPPPRPAPLRTPVTGGTAEAVIDLAAPSYATPPRSGRGDAENALEAFQRDGDWRDAVAAIVYSLLAAEAQLERIWGQL